MSRGQSKLQREIAGLLDGSLKGQVFHCAGGLCTAELLEELIERGTIDERVPRKAALFTIRRACRSLVKRGVLDVESAFDCDLPWVTVLCWSAMEHLNGDG